MPTKDELERENAELKAQLEALQPAGHGYVCVLCGEGIAECRYYVRHPEYDGAPPVCVCYDCFYSHLMAGGWVADMDGEVEPPRPETPPDPEEEPNPEEEAEPAEDEGEDA